MPQFRCVCGKRISLVRSPNEYEGTLSWDVDRDKLDEAVSRTWGEFLAACGRGKRDAWVRAFYGARGEGIDNLTGRELAPVDPAVSISDVDVLHDVVTRADDTSLGVARCPECRRLYVQRAPFVNEYDCYRLEPE